MDAFTGYAQVERVLAHGDDQVQRPAARRLPGRPAPRAAREPRRRAAVLHRLEGPQHRAARPRAPARLQAERVRPVPASTTTARSPATTRTRSTRRSVWRSIAAGAAREPRRDRGGRTRHAAGAGRARRPARRPAHAHDRDRRPRPTSRRWRARRATPGLRYIAITDHSQALAMANGLDETRGAGARARASARSTTGSTASRCSPASSATSAPTARWISPTTASPSSTSSSPRSTRRFTQEPAQMTDRHPARARLPVGGRPRRIRPGGCCCGARAISSTWSACSPRRPRRRGDRDQQPGRPARSARHAGAPGARPRRRG